MSNTKISRPQARGAAMWVVVVVAAFAALSVWAVGARAATWKGLEPLTWKRADVERVLGAPVSDKLAQHGTLHFNVTGGAVTVQFVDAKFVAAKKLAPEAEGTVLQIVLQHERATDTPESLSLGSNKDFERDEKGNVAVYRNLKDGIFYTFVDGKLKTTRYAASTEQIVRAQKR
ncbi:MAG TPA: hypothetical protein VE360_18760 [Pyrinomonadaceae bacterium]|nr:hypothetical protein [Pyrinomonadaceae bacterium]